MCGVDDAARVGVEQQQGGVGIVYVAHVTQLFLIERQRSGVGFPGLHVDRQEVAVVGVVGLGAGHVVECADHGRAGVGAAFSPFAEVRVGHVVEVVGLVARQSVLRHEELEGHVQSFLVEGVGDFVRNGQDLGLRVVFGRDADVRVGVFRHLVLGHVHPAAAVGGVEHIVRLAVRRGAVHRVGDLATVDEAAGGAYQAQFRADEAGEVAGIDVARIRVVCDGDEAFAVNLLHAFQRQDALRAVGAVHSGEFFHHQAFLGFEGHVADGCAHGVGDLSHLHADGEVVHLSRFQGQRLFKGEGVAVAVLEREAVLFDGLQHVLLRVEQRDVDVLERLFLRGDVHAAFYYSAFLGHHGGVEREDDVEVRGAFDGEVVHEDGALVLVLVHEGHVDVLPGVFSQ